MNDWNRIFRIITLLAILIVPMMEIQAQPKVGDDGHFTNLYLASKSPEKVKYLDLSYQEWRYIPKIVTMFPHLEYLDLSGNYIQQVPKWFVQMRSLRHLKLNNNMLAFFPIALEVINPQLITLEISDNSIMIDDYLNAFGDNLPDNLK